jgi:hypothetical protein
MMRQCTRCGGGFVPGDLAREESRGMESERKEAGLLGVRFLYYRCHSCGTEDIFIDVLPREGESPDDYATRYAAMLTAARNLHTDKAEKTDVVVVPVKPPPEIEPKSNTSE